MKAGHGTAFAAKPAPLASWPDDPKGHVSSRKSAKVEILVARQKLVAYPYVDANGEGSGGLCFGDLGGPLFLEDGSLAGVFVNFASDVRNAWFYDDITPCRADAGANYSFLFDDLRAFIDARRAAIHVGR